jgi:hypothetical protein
MDQKIKYQIFTGPMEKDWLVAELLYDDEHIGDLVEWGEKLILYPRIDGEYWNLPVVELLETIKSAREEVRFIPKDDSEPDSKK